MESDFYQNSQLVGILLINESEIRINNISITTNKVEIYWNDNVKVILYQRITIFFVLITVK